MGHARGAEIRKMVDDTWSEVKCTADGGVRRLRAAAGVKLRGVAARGGGGGSRSETPRIR